MVLLLLQVVFSAFQLWRHSLDMGVRWHGHRISGEILLPRYTCICEVIVKNKSGVEYSIVALAVSPPTAMHVTD